MRSILCHELQCRSRQRQSPQLAEYTFIYIISIYRLIYTEYSDTTRKPKFVLRTPREYIFSCRVFHSPLCRTLSSFCLFPYPVRQAGTPPCHRSYLLGAAHQHPSTVIFWMLHLLPIMWIDCGHYVRKQKQKVVSMDKHPLFFSDFAMQYCSAGAAYRYT